jgi:hypothetical protein
MSGNKSCPDSSLHSSASDSVLDSRSTASQQSTTCPSNIGQLVRSAEGVRLITTPGGLDFLKLLMSSPMGLDNIGQLLSSPEGKLLLKSPDGVEFLKLLRSSVQNADCGVGPESGNSHSSCVVQQQPNPMISKHFPSLDQKRNISPPSVGVGVGGGEPSSRNVQFGLGPSSVPVSEPASTGAVDNRCDNVLVTGAVRVGAGDIGNDSEKTTSYTSLNNVSTRDINFAVVSPATTRDLSERGSANYSSNHGNSLFQSDTHYMSQHHDNSSGGGGVTDSSAQPPYLSQSSGNTPNLSILSHESSSGSLGSLEPPLSQLSGSGVPNLPLFSAIDTPHSSMLESTSQSESSSSASQSHSNSSLPVSVLESDRLESVSAAGNEIPILSVFEESIPRDLKSCDMVTNRQQDQVNRPTNHQAPGGELPNLSVLNESVREVMGSPSLDDSDLEIDCRSLSAKTPTTVTPSSHITETPAADNDIPSPQGGSTRTQRSTTHQHAGNEPEISGGGTGERVIIKEIHHHHHYEKTPAEQQASNKIINIYGATNVTVGNENKIVSTSTGVQYDEYGENESVESDDDDGR